MNQATQSVPKNSTTRITCAWLFVSLQLCVGCAPPKHKFAEFDSVLNEIQSAAQAASSPSVQIAIVDKSQDLGTQTTAGERLVVVHKTESGNPGASPQETEFTLQFAKVADHWVCQSVKSVLTDSKNRTESTTQGKPGIEIENLIKMMRL